MLRIVPQADCRKHRCSQGLCTLKRYSNGPAGPPVYSAPPHQKLIQSNLFFREIMSWSRSISNGNPNPYLPSLKVTNEYSNFVHSR